MIPPPVLRNLGIGVGQRLTLDTTADGKIVLTPKRKYALADMIAQCDLTAPPPADLALWDVGHREQLGRRLQLPVSRRRRCSAEGGAVECVTRP